MFGFNVLLYQPIDNFRIVFIIDDFTDAKVVKFNVRFILKKIFYLCTLKFRHNDTYCFHTSK